jgi:hypothetical protein
LLEGDIENEKVTEQAKMLVFHLFTVEGRILGALKDYNREIQCYKVLRNYC